MARQAKAPGTDKNLLGQGTVIEGTLQAAGEIHVSGRIVGKLEVDGRAVVAQDGAVEGELEATNADIAGSVEGQINVSERLLLRASARIDGDIRVERLVVEEGAVFTGRCEMGEAARKAPRPSATVTGAPGRSLCSRSLRSRPVRSGFCSEPESANSRSMIFWVCGVAKNARTLLAMVSPISCTCSSSS